MPIEDLIQAPWISDRLLKGLGIKSRVATPLVGPELQPVVIVGDLAKDSSRDSTILRRCTGAGFVVAAGTARCEIFNPATSGVVILLDDFSMASTGAGLRIIGAFIIAASAASNGLAEYCDASVPGTPVAQLVGFDAAPPANICARYRVSNVSLPSIPVNFWLPPGNGFVLATEVAATLDVTWRWREIPLLS